MECFDNRTEILFVFVSFVSTQENFLSQNQTQDDLKDRHNVGEKKGTVDMNIIVASKHYKKAGLEECSVEKIRNYKVT